MARRAISHRKLASPWAGLGVLLVAGAGLVIATLFAPVNGTPAAPIAAPPIAASAPTPVIAPDLAEIDVALDLTDPAPERAARRRARTGVPLNAAVEGRSDDYEILTAAELDAISQASH